MPVTSASNVSGLGRLLLSAFQRPEGSGDDPIEKYLPAFGGDEDEMGNAAMAAREGQAIPGLEGASKEDLAELDRYGNFKSVGEKTGVLGLPLAAGTAAGYEYLGKNPMIGELLATVLRDPQYRIDERSSKPSMRNVSASLRGFLAGAGKR